MCMFIIYIAPLTNNHAQQPNPRTVPRPPRPRALHGESMLVTGLVRDLENGKRDLARSLAGQLALLDSPQHQSPR